MTSVIKDKVALVTGGASGIGYQFVSELLKHGAKGVMIADFNESLAEKAVKELGKKVNFIKTNVCDKVEFENAFKKTIECFGRVDIVINNAGSLNEERWLNIINTNVIGVAQGTQLAFVYMGKNNGGQGGIVINTSSIAGLRTYSAFPTYTATKHFVTAYTRSFGTPFYYDQSGVKLIAICPGFTRTPLLNTLVSSSLFKNHKEYIEKVANSHPTQEVEFVGKSLIDVLGKAQNGNCWLIEGGKPASLVDSLQPVI